MIPHLIEERPAYISAHCPMCQFPLLILPAPRPFHPDISAALDYLTTMEETARAARQVLEAAVLP